MTVNSISISNYRSISNLTLKIDKIGKSTCLILLGKNETGKSSILKAISLLNKESLANYEQDCNKKARKLKEDISVELDLKFESFESYKKMFGEWGIPESLQDKVVIKRVLYTVSIDVSNDKEYYLTIYLESDKVFSDFLYSSLTGLISDVSDVYDGGDVLTESNVKSIVGDEYSLLKKSELEHHLEEKMLTMIEENTPSSLFWEPSNDYLINESIDLDLFADDNNISKPLKNIFNIAKVEDVKDRVELIRDNIEEKSELKEVLAKSITEYINKVWPEHSINIFIEIENMMCSVMIEDKDDPHPKYNMNQRSDGFKQFMSILLNLSIENKDKGVRGKIILLDEPEVHLHPSGIRDLRDEILKIGEENIVIISTHSLYFIDKLHLGRHYKVSKNKSITEIKQIEENNPYEEEVIYEALGTSIYEHIQPNMIVFEGKTDKDIFDAFSYKFRTELKPVSIGTISADGVDKIPQYTKFIDGKFVKGFVLVDSDNAGEKVKKVVLNSSAFSADNTFEINDLLDTGKKATLEDLYPKDVIESLISNNFSININLDDTPVVKQVEKYNSSSQSKINDKEFKGQLVNWIIQDLSKLTKVEAKEKYSKYYEFVNELHKRLKN